MDIKKARKTLELSQEQLAAELGWSGKQQVSNLETGSRPIQKQTELAIECLLRREKKFERSDCKSFKITAVEFFLIGETNESYALNIVVNDAFIIQDAANINPVIPSSSETCHNDDSEKQDFFSDNFDVADVLEDLGLDYKPTIIDKNYDLYEIVEEFDDVNLCRWKYGRFDEMFFVPK